MSIHQPTPENLIYLAQRIVDGKLVGIPTETVYGLAALAYSKEACLKIFAFKNRPATDPLIVHVCSSDEIKNIAYINFPKTFAGLLSLWPGPLTIILPAKMPPLNSTIAAGGSSVGVRIPQQEDTLELLKLTGPLAAPSANKFGHISPVCAADVEKEFFEYDIDVLDGGHCQIGIESTVLRIDAECDITVLRRGAITDEHIKKAVPGCRVSFLSVSQSTAEPMQAPGASLTHYAIAGAMTYIITYKAVDLPGVSYFSMDSLLHHNRPSIINCGGLDEQRLCQLAEEIGCKDILEIGDAPQRLFYASLRELESRGIDCCIIVGDTEMMNENMQGISASLFDRIFRAASGRVVILSQ